MGRNGDAQLRSISLFTICAISVFFYTASFMRVPIVPLYASDLGASTLFVGVIMSSYMVTAAVLAFPMGYISDRRGRRLIIVAGMVLSMTSSVLLFFTTDVIQIFLVYAIAGVGSGMASPAITALVGDISKSSSMARSYGWFSTSLHIGTTSGPALGGVIAGLFGYQSVFVLSAISGGMALVLTLLFIRKPRGVKAPEPDTDHPPAVGIRLNLGLPVSLGWLNTFTYAFSVGVIHPFFPLYATSNGMGLEVIGALFAVQSIFNALSRIPMGYLSDHFGTRVPFILASMLFLSIGTAACVATTDFVQLVLIFAVIGFASGTSGMAISTMIAESSPPGTRGMAMGGQSAARYGGRAISPLMVGAILPASGYFASFAIAAVVCGTGLLSFLTLLKKRR